jgi:peptidoglycan/xylan/chitin deacetylase (PgdA/CDA1 family)
MKEKIYTKIKFLVDHIPLKFYQKYCHQKTILPFYHTVTDILKPHLSELGYFRTTIAFFDDIDFLLKNYESVDIENVNKTSNHSFYLTFDDGLSELFHTVAPFLKDKNLSATFFINSDFIDNKKMFYRHKISILLSLLKNSVYNQNKIGSLLEIENGDLSNEINRIKNEEVINQIASNLQFDFDEYLNENKPYLSSAQLIELKKQGFTIGNHSKGHLNFKDLNLEEQIKQIMDCNIFLNNLLDLKEMYFSFPFGDENIENGCFDFMYSKGRIKRSLVYLV